MVKLAYLIAAVLFIVGLKLMSRPRTAVRGNAFGAAGMLLAIVVTFFDIQDNWPLIIGSLLVGGIVGGLLALRIQMTDMPQLVALFNGFGGAASVLVAGSEIYRNAPAAGGWAEQAAVMGLLDVTIAIAASGLIGAVTFWGSLVAFGKLQELSVFDKPLTIPQGQWINAGLALTVLLLATLLVRQWNRTQDVGVYPMDSMQTFSKYMMFRLPC